MLLGVPPVAATVPGPQSFQLKTAERLPKDTPSPLQQ
jgi:hypothetical protein